jgi:serine/threonine protein kinase/Tfp pilus assembly protein PilF
MKCPKCATENTSDSQFCKKCAAPLASSTEISVSLTETLQTPIPELTRGMTLAGRYEIIEELGKGGMGKVYRVEDKKIKGEIALKLIKPEIAAEKQTIERFSNELKLTRMISHRNVCRMFDLGEDKGTYFITMEYVPGEDLKSFIRRARRLDVGTAISIAKQICEGLAEAHRLGVVHRDLKPGNIMIDKEGNARIMDFGIARSLHTKGLTADGVIIGTPEYMSPEQVEGEEADQCSDIYALGVILYEMVTGRVPFEGTTPFSVALKHKSEVPPNPRTLTPQLPEDLSRLILRCLEKQRSKRYQSAAEVLSELDKIEKGIPTTEKILLRRKPLTSREITVKFNLRKLYLPGLAIIALVIAAVILMRLLPRRPLSPAQPGKPSLAVMYFENDTGDKNLDYWRKALSDLLITDLMQSRYIRVLSAESLYDILKDLNLLEAGSYSREDLRRIAARGGVENILVGKYARAGDLFRIDTVLQKASTGEPVGPPQRGQGKGQESFFSLVDELTKSIKASLNLTTQEIASDNDKEVGKITTSSPEAYKFYSEGRKFHQMGDYVQSIPLMEKAIAIDPNFAMAYRSLAIAYGNQGSSSERARNLQKAFELSARTSERERYIIEGDYYLQWEKTYDKAVEVYKKLLELYPDDAMGYSKLAWLYSDLEQWDKAIENSEKSIKYKADDIYIYEYLASGYENKELYEKAVEVLQGYLNTVSDNRDIRLDLADAYFYQKKFDLALAEVEKAYTLDPTYFNYFLSKGDIYLYQGDFVKAEEQYQKLLNLKEPRAQRGYLYRMMSLSFLRGKLARAKSLAQEGIEASLKSGEKGSERSFRTWSGDILRISGNLEEAMGEYEKVLAGAVEDDDWPRQLGTLHNIGLAYLDMKVMDRAEKTADELYGLIQKGVVKNDIRVYDHLMGRIELERKNYSRAMDYFDKALALVPYHWQYNLIFRSSLALAYHRAGNLEKARQECEKIQSLPCGRANYGDIFVLNFYNLGRIYEQLGQKAKAVESYQKFLDLWKDADPGLSAVEDAKTRLARLKS